MKKFLIEEKSFLPIPSRRTIEIFSFFSIFNYIFLYFNSDSLLLEHNNNTYRIIAAALAAILLLSKKLPSSFNRFINSLWYITICYSIPFFGSLMLLENPSSFIWQSNNIIGLFWFGLITDWVAFVVLLPTSIVSAIIYFWILHGNLDVELGNFQGMLGHYCFAMMIALIFSRNKELVAKALKIEELSGLNKKLESQSKELTRALAAKMEFLNNISHEIRTPIQGFCGIAAGLQDHWQSLSEEEKIGYIEQIVKNSTRLSSLVGNLLDLSKTSEGKMILDKENFDLAAQVELMIDEVKSMYLAGKAINISFTCSKQMLVLADRERIAQALRNLFVNAVKFTPSGGEIKASLSKQGAMLHFVISDNGVGLPPEELEAIFLPFLQSSRTKTKAGGTGLGLAISREIIEAHGGKVWAENNADQGASFHFTLPGIIHQSDADPAAREKPKVILAIDDEETCLATIELLLKTSDFQLITTIGGLSALELLNKGTHVDLILLDLMMPDIYGLDLLKKLKNNKSLRHIPVILQSGTSDENEVQKAFELGVIDYIRKPFSKNIIINKVTAHLLAPMP